jgi:transcriptional/translational regulatory protein YebC/TACO1
VAGHSHSANIKHRKDRQDIARGQLFLKLRKKLEIIIRQEGCINEKSLIIARENQFPKEKLNSILEKIRLDVSSKSEKFLYKANFGIILYIDSFICDNVKKTEKEFGLKRLPISLLNSNFNNKILINLDTDKKNIEEILISFLPSEYLEKIEYNSHEKVISLDDRKILREVKNILINEIEDLKIISERSV